MSSWRTTTCDALIVPSDNTSCHNSISCFNKIMVAESCVSVVTA